LKHCLVSHTLRSAFLRPLRRLPRVRSRGLGAARLGAVVLALAGAACGGDEGASDKGAGPERPETMAAAPSVILSDAMACGAEGLEPCDVLDVGCQQALADIAACQWGGAGTASVLPPVNTLTSAELLEQLTATSAAGTQVPAALQLGFGTILEWLGLAQPSAVTTESTNELIASLYLALYNFQSQEITLIEDARTGDARVDDELLFHELVHVQQDKRYGLADLASSFVTTDNAIAFRSLVEGEAQFHQTLFDLAAFHVAVTPDTVDQSIEFLRSRQESEWLAEPSSAWTRSVVLAGYLYGQFMIRDWWYEAGPAGMVPHFADPPRESLRMLEAAFGREPTQSRIWAVPANNIFASVGQALPMPGNEQYPLAADRLGAWTIYMLAQLAGDDELARGLALGWRGDQLDLFQLADGGFAARFRVSFDTPDNATEFARLLSEKDKVQVRSSGTFVVAALSDQPVKPDWLFGPLQSP
jgi:hypothetical protein